MLRARGWANPLAVKIGGPAFRNRCEAVSIGPIDHLPANVKRASAANRRRKNMIKGVNINSGDLMGRRFNGFDLRPYLAHHDVAMRQLVYWNKQSDADFVEKAFDYPGDRHITRALNRLEGKLSMHARLHPHSWTLPHHQTVREADFVHLHIIHDGYFSLSALPYLTHRKPTVWTWHDPWPMTGHCIYPMGCDRYQTGCGSCPDLTLPFPMRKDRTAEQFAWKDSVYGKVKAEVILASKWMMDLASQSPLAQHFNFNLIPFGLDLDVYKPRDQDEARSRLGVIPGRPVIFLRSTSTPYKGLKQFQQALDRIDPELELCIIAMQETGHFNRFIGRHQIIEFGWTDDTDLILDAFAACDFFLMPSMAEAFGLMAIEAMACGKPVLTVNGTSLPDVSAAPEAGVCVEPNDIDGLADAIVHLSTNLDECRRRGARSLDIARERYDIRTQAELTAELYHRVLRDGIGKPSLQRTISA